MWDILVITDRTIPANWPDIVTKKVKCTLVQALRLCTGCTAHRGSRGITLLFLDHCDRRGWGVSVTPQLLFTPGKDPVPILQEAGWAPGPVWTRAENLAHTRIRSPDCPACSQSLYWLSYPDHKPIWYCMIKKRRLAYWSIESYQMIQTLTQKKQKN